MTASSGSFVPVAGAIAMTFLSFSARATPTQPSGAELERALDRVNTVGSVLYIAAHPDDENTRLLAYLVNNAKVRAAYLSMTRGEGGQNLIGSDLAPLLGLIRTHELLAARAIDGAEQMFGRERDFGYSKTPEETLQIWDKHEALGDVVWAIRRFRPDVIVTRFSPDQRDTHGHHTASAMLAVEAFTVAGDPNAFPDQLKYVQPWQAKRIVWNKGVFGPAKPGEVDGFWKLDIGGFDPLLGSSAGEVAARSRSMHKSQGFGASPQRGSIVEYFKLLGGAPFESSLFDGVDTTWKRVPGGDHVGPLLDKARAQFHASDPAASVPLLLEALAALDAAPESSWKHERHDALVELIVGCAGLYVDANVAEPTATPGAAIKLTINAITRSSVPVRLRAVRISGVETAEDKAIGREQVVNVEVAHTLDAKVPLTTPYWLAEEPTAGRWTVSDQTLVGLPAEPSPVRVELDFMVGARVLTIARTAEYAWNDPVAGERRRPLEIVPPVILAPSTPLLVFSDATPKTIKVSVRPSRAGVAIKGKLACIAPKGFSVEPAEHAFALKPTDEETTLEFHVKPPANADTAQLGTLTLNAMLDGGVVADSTVTRLEYAHLPTLTIVRRADIKLLRFNHRRGVAHLGYVAGAGDDVPAALRQAGYDVTMLSDEALTQSLTKYDAIVLGVRAFNVNKKLPSAHEHLMAYVKNGGTIVVQYNTNNRISKLETPMGPWPFTISQDRVTEENAVVTRAVDHAIFHAPNALDDHDFAGWVQERGLYFATPFDAQYVAPLSMHDANEPAKRGALLVGKYGKGAFIYTGLAFFRQLPAGVPGAFRLFSNLLAVAGHHAK